MDTEVEIDPYELIGVKTEATEQEIKTAYRQRSLKVHPDRNPNNPDAARKFHELNQAYELLLDPLRRLALDAKLRIKLARVERFKSFDTKRKNMVDELEERERAFKKSKVDKEKEEISRWQTTEKIKEEGRKMREEREKQLKEREMHAAPRAAEKLHDDLEAPVLDPLDTTVRLKYSLKDHPELTTAGAIAQLLARFGATDADSIVLSLKSSKKAADKPPKTGTALVPFKQIGDAYAAVCASKQVEKGLRGVEVGWVGGKEPQILGCLKKMGKLEPPTSSGASSSSTTEEKATTSNSVRPQLPQTDTGSTFSSFPSTFRIPNSKADDCPTSRFRL
ncbi:DnaJ-domain-containing protein [Pluteus cervinus]|uniref:DnaJ-domain-containing protein n=1 Tax=Pluteus cervinus TaxID=181527 RepID=A0ACD3B652_9AGAR|nr:DnaJ-domain-containing protein [Pluteus cervinus]